MARSSRKKKTKKKNGYTIEIVGLVLILMSFFAIGQWGFVGTLITNFYRFFVGQSYSFLSVVLIGLGFYFLFKGKTPNFFVGKWTGGALIYMSVLVFLHWQLFQPIMNTNLEIISATWRFFLNDLLSNTTATSLGGGIIGALLYSVSYSLLSNAGTFLLIGILLFVGIMTFGHFSYKNLLTNVRKGAGNSITWTSSKVKERRKNNGKKKEKNKKSIDQRAKQLKDENKKDQETEKKDGTEIAAAQADQAGYSSGENVQTSLQIEDFQENTKAKEKQAEETAEDNSADESPVDFEVGEEENEDYKLPPINLLDTIKTTDQSAEYSTIEHNVKKLEETFESFGVDAKVVKANLGPAVTKYEIQPATGVKVSKIVNLSNDIALALAAKDIRMEAPIPGKSVIGIEVPNTDVTMVSFREVIEKQPKNSSLLEVPLGRDIAGNIQMLDINKMPHLLIAGATGSGKSVGINSMIVSLLLKAKPNEVKLMMIDPKMVELNVYNEIPHLLTPVVTNPKKAAQALNKVVQEMERRYELFAASGTRNMASYNEFVEKKNKETDESLVKLPYIVVIVDELADLMMVASNDVENAITRLAQMARAAGIHMILATQRPSVDVITGIIKANVPSRIAFAVSSGTDSRTILDSNGAEKLLGRGDMLYVPMGANKPNRVQGAFISDTEVEKVVDFVKEQQESNYVEEMIPDDKPEKSKSEPEDELYDDAVELVIEMETASISLLQRRFRIGYNRAARIVDEMEAHGVVGPKDGSKPREVLATKEEEQTPPPPSTED